MKQFRPASAGLLLLTLPPAVWAHSPIKNIGGFYNGILHPLLVPAHLLTIVVLGLLLGQHNGRRIQPAIPAFMLALTAGLAGVRFGYSYDAETFLLVATLLLGLLVIIDKPLPAIAYPLFAICCGVLIGLDSAQQELADRQLTGALYGSGLGASLLLVYAAGLSEYLQKPWQRILTRVLASWSTASALLVLTFVLSGNRGLTSGNNPENLSGSENQGSMLAGKPSPE